MDTQQPLIYHSAKEAHLVEGVDLDGGLRGHGQRALGALAGGLQAPHRAWVAARVFLVLALELLRERGGNTRARASAVQVL